MRLADRYIGKQIVSGTLYAVLVLSLILVLGQLFKEVRPLLVEQRAPIVFIAKMIAQFLPFSLMFTLPWGFLVAVLLVFGRMSADNELLSLRMSGQSLLRIAAPALVIGLFFSALCFWLVGTLAPRAKNEMKEMLYSAFKDNPKILLEPGIMQSRFQGQKVYVEARGEEKLRGLHICQLTDDEGEDSRLGSYIHAGRVSLQVDQERKMLKLKLEDVFTESIDAEGNFQMAMGEEAEPWHLDFSGSKKKKQPKANRLDNEQLRAAIAGNEVSANKRFSYQAELAKRWSLSFACLAFAFIGVPLGLQAQRRESSRGMMVSFGVAALYFGSLMMGEQLSGVPIWVTQTVCIAPLFICMGLGIWLLRRANHA